MNVIKNKFKWLGQLVSVLAIILVANWISIHWFTRIDLTTEKRYTLSPITKSYLESLDSAVVIKVFLGGDLNVGFTQLATATREMLEEFDASAIKSIRFEFINPNDGDAASKNAILDQLHKYNFEPQAVFETAEDGSKIQSYVFPYALVAYNGKMGGVNLLDNLPGKSGDENLNISIEGLEFKLMDALRRLAMTQKPRIAFLEGHGELDEMDVIEATDALSAYYQVERGQIGNDPAILDPYKVVIIAKPHLSFSEKDKFVLDQYLMQGGRLFVLMDAVNITLDSLRSNNQTVGLYSDVNLGDQLFKYGVRVNPVVVEDVQAGRILINVPTKGEPKLVPVPWLYSPLLSVSPNHSITRNINLVRGDFTGTIDTTGNDMHLYREVLLRTSQMTKVTQTPVFVNMMDVNKQPDRAQFSHSFLPVAVLQEGVFPSVFHNRQVPAGLIMGTRKVKDHSITTRMVIVADGDIIKNEVRFKETKPRIAPLGYDEGTRQVYGNKDFVVNAVNYLCDDEGWTALRNRSLTLRLLDRDKVSQGANFWKWLNLLAPLFIILLGSGIFVIWRHKKYGK